MLYKIVNGLFAIPPEQYISRNERPSRAGHPQTVGVIPSTSDYYKYSFFPRSVVLWNALPSSVVVLPPAGFANAVGRMEHTTP